MAGRKVSTSPYGRGRGCTRAPLPIKRGEVLCWSCVNTVLEGASTGFRLGRPSAGSLHKQPVSWQPVSWSKATRQLNVCAPGRRQNCRDSASCCLKSSPSWSGLCPSPEAPCLAWLMGNFPRASGGGEAPPKPTPNLPQIPGETTANFQIWCFVPTDAFLR